MRKTQSKYIFTFVLLHIVGMAMAQIDPCVSSLKEANQKYEEGWFDESVAILESSLADCELSKTERIAAYKLLILNYLGIDNIEKAEASTAAIMKIDPNYEADKVQDPTEVILLFKKYKPSEELKIRFSGGPNFSQVTASEVYPVTSTADESDLSNYESKTGYQFALTLEKRLYKALWLQGGLGYRNVSYSNTLTNIENRSINYSEKLGYLDVPLMAKYYFREDRFTPYAQAGVAFSFLNSALGELSRDNVSDLVDRKNQRNTFNIGYVIGGGASYRIKNLSFQAGVNYMYAPANLPKEGTRYDNVDLVFKYYYLDNDFAMNNWQIDLGITYNLVYKNTLTDGGK
jgi:opacity protein-like surface antigen